MVEAMNHRLAEALRHRLAWPLLTLLLLLAVNAIFNADFLHIEWRAGHLYGSLIDILNRAAPLALVAAVAVAGVCGLWNGVLVARVGMQPIIATLILMVAGRGIAQLITSGQIITIYYAPFFFLGNGFLLGLPFAVFIAAAVWTLLHLLMTRTALGMFIQAIGINPAAARVAGVQE